MRTALALIAAALTTGWGIAHLFPTRSVVSGFGDIGTENRRVITMEWIFEGVTLIFAGALTAAVSLASDDRSTTATVAFIVIAALLTVMAVISLLTAGRNRFIAYRLCAPIFAASAILLLASAATG
jgi:hypothetical protein